MADIRLRVEFEACLGSQQVFLRQWCQPKAGANTVKELAEQIVDQFRLRTNSILLSLRGFALSPDTPTSLLRDGDIVVVTANNMLQVEGTALDLRQASLVVPGHDLKAPITSAAKTPSDKPLPRPLLLGNGTPKAKHAGKQGSGAGAPGKRGQASRSADGAAAMQQEEPAAKKRKTEAVKGSGAGKAADVTPVPAEKSASQDRPITQNALLKSPAEEGEIDGNLEEDSSSGDSDSDSSEDEVAPKSTPASGKKASRNAKRKKAKRKLIRQGLIPRPPPRNPRTVAVPTLPPPLPPPPLPKRGDAMADNSEYAEFMKTGHVRFAESDEDAPVEAIQNKIDAATHAAQVGSQEAQGSQEGRDRNSGHARDSGGVKNGRAEGGAASGHGTAANERSSGRAGAKQQDSDNNPWRSLAFGNHTAAEQRSYHAVAPPAAAPPHQAPPILGINFEALPHAEGLPQEGTLVAYKLLEIDASFCPVVSEWRRGKVSVRDSEANTLVVVPWPNPGVHPVEAVRLAREAAAEYEDDEYEEEAPPSDYDDAGVLTTSRDNFQDLRVMAESRTSTLPGPPAAPAGASVENGVRNEDSQHRDSGKGTAAKQPPAKLPMVPRVLRQGGEKTAPAAGGLAKSALTNGSTQPPSTPGETQAASTPALSPALPLAPKANGTSGTGNHTPCIRPIPRMQRGQNGTPQTPTLLPGSSRSDAAHQPAAIQASSAAMKAPLSSPEVAAAFEKKRKELAEALRDKAANGNNGELKGDRGAGLAKPDQHSVSKAASGCGIPVAADSAGGAGPKKSRLDGSSARTRGAGVGLVGPLLARLRADEAVDQAATVSSEIV